MARDKKLKPLPKRPDEALAEQIVPYTSVPKSIGETPFTKNRGNDISLNDEKIKDFTIGLKDIDEALVYYFKNVIKPSVVQNGQRVPVPIMYNNPEMWTSIQADGYTRDKNGKLLAPFITFKRENIEKNRMVGNKLDGNQANLYQIFEKKYTQHNIYDRFSLISNREPVREFIKTVVPDYVNITYSCVIFTNYIEQINPIVEAINYVSDSYWGDLKRFKFKSRIDNFSTITELNIDEDRVVKSNFTLVLNGYLIPEVMVKDLSSSKKFYSKSQILFNFETSTSDLETVTSSKIQKPIAGSTSIDSYNINIGNGGGGGISVSQDTLDYINTNIQKKATTVIVPNIAIFTNVQILQPPSNSDLPATTVSNFLFFINGQYIPSSLVTLSEGSGTITAIFNTTQLEYTLESTDEVIIIGKLVISLGAFDGGFDGGFN